MFVTSCRRQHFVSAQVRAAGREMKGFFWCVALSHTDTQSKAPVLILPRKPVTEQFLSFQNVVYAHHTGTGNQSGLWRPATEIAWAHPLFLNSCHSKLRNIRRLLSLFFPFSLSLTPHPAISSSPFRLRIMNPNWRQAGWQASFQTWRKATLNRTCSPSAPGGFKTTAGFSSGAFQKFKTKKVKKWKKKKKKRKKKTYSENSGNDNFGRHRWWSDSRKLEAVFV